MPVTVGNWDTIIGAACIGWGMAEKKVKQTRHWCVTVNAKKEDGGEWLPEELMEFESNLIHLVNMQHVRYAVWQVEQGDKAEVQHIQMYVEFMRPKRMNEAKTVIGYSWAHLEPRWGSRTQARDYCMKKDGTELTEPTEVGHFRPDAEGTKALHRSLADMCVDLVLQGLHPHQVAKRVPAAYFAHHRKVWALWKALNGIGE